MKATKKPVTIECFKYDGDLKNSNGEYYVPEWAVEAEKNGTNNALGDRISDFVDQTQRGEAVPGTEPA